MGVPWTATARCQSSCVTKLLVGVRGWDAIFSLAAVRCRLSPVVGSGHAGSSNAATGIKEKFNLEQLFCPQHLQALLCLSGLVFSTSCLLLWCAVLASVHMKKVCLQGCPEEPCRNPGPGGVPDPESSHPSSLRRSWAQPREDSSFSSVPAQRFSPQKEHSRVWTELQPPSVSLRSLWAVTVWHPQSFCYLEHSDTQYSTHASLQSNPCSLLYQVFVQIARSSFRLWELHRSSIYPSTPYMAPEG